MKIIQISLISLFATICSYGQHAVVSDMQKETAPLHGEALLIHVNSSFFVTGEKMLFQIYCFDTEHGKPSDLSTLAYVELVGEDGKTAAQLKARLNNGVGMGDFLIHDGLTTGNYTLLAYTRWMRNYDDTGFFRRTIAVINPLVKPKINKDQRIQTDERNDHPAGPVVLNMDKASYAKRAKGSLTLHHTATDSVWLSVNVRSTLGDVKPNNPWSDVSMTQPELKELNYLPDLRGELIAGKVTLKNNGKPVVGHLVGLSAPSKNNYFGVASTNKQGRYYFNAHDLTSDRLIFTMITNPDRDVEVHQEPTFLNSYGNFIPNKLIVDSSKLKMIEGRHVALQIEQAFHTVKQDSVLVDAPHRPFFFEADKVYNMKDYTLFPTMEDVFREIIAEVVVKLRDGNFSLVLTNSATGFRFTNPPLVLIDGIPVKEANELMRYDPSLIKTISLVTERYYYGGLETDGILNIETFNGDAKNLSINALTTEKHLQPLAKKLYYFPDYDKGKDLSRIPDFRPQLLWIQDVSVQPGAPTTLTFFTGDAAGEYFVEIVGISSSGDRIYAYKTFEVR